MEYIFCSLWNQFSNNPSVEAIIIGYSCCGWIEIACHSLLWHEFNKHVLRGKENTVSISENRYMV